MKKLFILLIGSASFLLSSLCYGQKDTLTILHVNDTHSCLAPLGPRDEFLKGSFGGIARAATVIGLNRMSEPNVVVLHSGDVFIGDIFFNTFFGAAELQLMNAIGFDALTLGNHEFDLEPSTLEASFQNSFSPEEGFPVLSANFLLFEDTLQTLRSYVKSCTDLNRGMVKVGIFGLNTPETNLLSFPSPAIIDTNFVQIAKMMVDSLSSLECSVIICLSHLGFELDKILSEYVPAIDVIVGGHDHYTFSEPYTVTSPTGKSTYIVQAGAFYSHVGKMKLEITSGQIDLLRYELIALDNTIPEEPGVQEVVNNLIAEVENTYGPLFTQQIGNAESFFEEVADPIKNGYSDTPVGNLVTDAFRERTGTDIAIEPGGSTAQPIYPGPLVSADIFRTVGYGFNLVNGLGYRIATFKMSGMDILSGLEFGLSNIEQNDEFLIQVSGLSYGFDISKPPYQRLIYVMVAENPLDPSKIYSVTANEFVLGFLQSFLGIQVSDITLYEDLTEFQVLIEYISGKGTIYPGYGNRITDLNFKEEKSQIKNEFRLYQNYPNPFNPTTTIEYSIPKESNVSIKVFDVLGKDVETLVNEEKPAGFYTVNFDGSGLSSGVYFYRITAGNFVETKKLILIR